MRSNCSNLNKSSTYDDNNGTVIYILNPSPNIEIFHVVFNYVILTVYIISVSDSNWDAVNEWNEDVPILDIIKEKVTLRLGILLFPLSRSY